MNILFDQSEAQSRSFNGAAEYAQTLFLHIVQHLADYPDVKLYCMYASDKKFLYSKLAPESYNACPNVEYVDMNGKTLRQLIEENQIDLFFTPCVQLLCDLKLGSLERLPCRIIAVVHDFLHEEMERSRMMAFQGLAHPYRLMRYYLSRAKQRLMAGSIQSSNKVLEKFLRNNNVEVVTVSEYSRASFLYNYPTLTNPIHVFYAPMKTAGLAESIENEQLRDVIERGERYMLIVSANRPLKNAERMIHAFRLFAQQYDYSLITVGYGASTFERHISLPYLSASDLENAYAHCTAFLYPSLFEGFGYPPLEATKYGKPVLCSYACSMPEVLSDAPIYFAPIYETDMYKALCSFASMPYEELVNRSLRQFEIVCLRQRQDLDRLTHKLLS